MLFLGYTKPYFLRVDKDVHAQTPADPVFLTPTPTSIVTPTPTIIPLASPFHGKPVRLIIPILHTDTTIVPMGITTNGSMEVPDSITDAGWYKFGSRPGDHGTAVIAGHVDGKNGEPGVFFQLKQLKSGDAIGVEDEFGSISAFIVRETKSYEYSADTTEIFANLDGIHLNLITCEGSWDQLKQTYTKRLVVFADLMK